MKNKPLRTLLKRFARYVGLGLVDLAYYIVDAATRLLEAWNKKKGRL